MAGQIVLQVGLHPTLEDGDVHEAFSTQEIRRKNAEIICKQREPGILLEYYLQKTSQYRYVLNPGRTEITRIDQRTTDEVLCTWCKVPLFLSSYKGPIFGDTFYGCGGKTYLDVTAFDDIWTYIEVNTVYREADFPFYPWNENRRYLVLALNDFDDALMRSFTEPLMDGDVVVKKRKSYVSWRAGLAVIGVSEADVLNRKKPINVLHVRLNPNIVLTKSL